MAMASARFGSAVSFHEHRFGACEVAMRFAVRALPQRGVDLAAV
jgi:hypothetical protein